MDPTEAGRQRRGGVLPVPHTSWTTRRGNRVTVGGCCLPLPFGCLVTSVMVAGVVAARATRVVRRS